MPKTRYSEAKKHAKELYDLVPYITPRIALKNSIKSPIKIGMKN